MLAILVSFQVGIAPADSAPIRPIAELVHTTWTAREGGPTEVRALAQTDDGYLWIGTLSGLVRFDGVRFVPFAPRGGDTIPAGGVLRLLTTRDGSLWIVWRSGAVSRLREGRIASWGERDGLPATRRLAESPAGVLVAGTAKGLSSFIAGKWQDAGTQWGYPGKMAWSVWFDRGGTLWVETEDRVVYLPPGQSSFVDPGMRLRNEAGPADFAEEKDGTVWMAELQRSGHTVRRQGDSAPVTEVKVGTWVMLVDKRGSLWMGTLGDGLRRVMDPARTRGRVIAQFGPEAEQFTEKDGLLSNLVFAMYEDKEGGVWVASSRGLECFHAAPFTPVVTPGSIRPRMVVAAPDSSVWTAALNSPGVLRLGPRGRDTIPAGFYFTNLFPDSRGNIWTVDNATVYRLKDKRFLPLPLRPHAARLLSALIEDRSGSILVHDTQLGLFRLAGDSLVPVTLPGQTAPGYGILHLDRQGRVWLVQANRVLRYDAGRVAVFSTSDHTAPANIHNLFEDHSGTIWLSGDFGVARFEQDRFRSLATGFPGGNVYGVAEDDAGAWWAVTAAGLVRVLPGELAHALADSSWQISYRSFDLLDGLPGVVSGNGMGQLITRAADGRIWVATDSGVASVDPRRIPPTPAPTVLVEAVRIGGRELSPSEAGSIPPRTRNLEIGYTATQLSAAGRVRFRYRLAGLDPEWQEVGARRVAYYSDLAPGQYTFRVAASTGDGIWNEAAAPWSFRVLPAWYQTVLFRAAVVLLIGSLGGLGVALLQRQRHARERHALTARYEATLAERARIAQDLHDTLLQGFAGVTLQLKTAELALPEQPDIAAETIQRVQQLARASLREARERVWDMRETELGSDDLPAALAALAKQRTEGTSIEVALTTEGDRRRLSRQLEDAAFRIGREAVVNAARHAGCRRIELHFEFGAAVLRLEVRDDGRGFTSDEAAEAHKKGHFGLSGARERAAQLGGHCEVRARPEGGTILALELPLAT